MDAVGGIGISAIFNRWLHRNIAILEFYPIGLSLYLWGHKMANHSILFFTDNEALVHVINKQSCKDKALMICLDFRFKPSNAKHQPR